MSLTSTSNIKTQLTAALGDKGPLYFGAFQLYLKASISRQEFEDQMRDCLDTPHLRASLLSCIRTRLACSLQRVLYSAIAQLTSDIPL